MMHVIQIRDRSAQALDARRRPILTPRHRDVDLAGAVEGALDTVLDLGRALAQVRPSLWFF
jgi:hypothetical protein